MKAFQIVKDTTMRKASAILAVPLLACQQPTAEWVVARAAEAMGGSVSIEDVETLRIRMVYPDHEYPVISELSRPNRLRTAGEGNYVLVFDGERAAFLERPPAEDGTSQGPELVDAAYLKDLELDIAFVFPAFFDHPSEYLGVESVDGVEAHKLRVVLPLGVPLTYFIDADTYLPLKVTADITVDGNEYHPERVFSDYEDAGGIVYARTVTYSWMPDEVETATVQSVEVNVPLDESRFAIPPEIK